MDPYGVGCQVWGGWKLSISYLLTRAGTRDIHNPRQRIISIISGGLYSTRRGNQIVFSTWPVHRRIRDGDRPVKITDPSAPSDPRHRPPCAGQASLRPDDNKVLCFDFPLAQAGVLV